MEETQQSLLYKIKPLSDRLPSVKRPEGHVHFRTKMMWVAVVLILYFVMTNVYLYGLDRSSMLDMFAQYRTIMAGASGSLLQLGIGPIVTASIIMQLFVGAKIIKLDLSKRDDKACYQSVLKLLVIVMIIFEAIPQVAGYLTPSEGLTDAIGGVGGRLILILLLFVGSYIIFMMGYRKRYLTVHRRRSGAAAIHRNVQLGNGGHGDLGGSRRYHTQGDILRVQPVTR